MKVNIRIFLLVKISLYIYSVVSDWESQIVWTNDRKAREGMPLEKGRHIKPGKDTRNSDIHTHTQRSHNSYQLVYLLFDVEITGL